MFSSCSGSFKKVTEVTTMQNKKHFSVIQEIETL